MQDDGTNETNVFVRNRESEKKNVYFPNMRKSVSKLFMLMILPEGKKWISSLDLFFVVAISLFFFSNN